MLQNMTYCNTYFVTLCHEGDTCTQAGLDAQAIQYAGAEHHHLHLIAQHMVLSMLDSNQSSGSQLKCL